MSKFSDSTFYLAPSGYRETTLYPQKPLSSIGHLSVGRASSATRTNPAGQVEEVCYNLLQYSEDFSNAIWNKVNLSVTANNTIAPNGTITADKIVENTSTGFHRVVQSISGFVGSVVTYSIYLKASERTWALVWFDGEPAGAYVDLTTGALGTVSSGVTASVTSVGDGWFRCIISKSIVASANIAIYPATGNGGASYTGNGTSGIFVWGAQLVQGNLPKDYLYTSDRLNFPRVDYSDGSASFLLEPQRTNSIRNSTMVGTVTGSPGTIPTNWFSTNSGLTRTVVGIGVENGLSYIDLRFNGTATGTSVGVYFDNISLSGSQTWTSSAYIKIVGGVFNSSAIAWDEYNGGSYIGGKTQTISVTSTLDRYVLSATTAASCTNAYPTLYFYITSGSSYDFTVRIAQPQMELGAYVTTPIFTLGSAAATRLADTFTRNNIFTNNLISSSGGTWFVELKNNLSLTRDTFTLIPLIIGDGATSPNNGLLLRNSGGSSMRLEIRKLIAGSTSLLHTTTTDSTKLVIKWNGSSCDVFVNGIKQVSASFFATTNMDFLVGNGVDVPKYITQMALWNTPLSDSQCIELTGVAYTTPAQAYGSLNLVSESPDCLYTSVNTINRI